MIVVGEEASELVCGKKDSKHTEFVQKCELYVCLLQTLYSVQQCKNNKTATVSALLKK